MALFENFPYTNLHELNLDWIISVIKDFQEKYPDVISEINNKLNKAINGNGAAGDILTSNGDGTVSWTSSQDLDPELIANAVFEWLDEHPEATTTVEDGSITEIKLAQELYNQLKTNSFVDSLHIRTGAFITSNENGVTAAQGMCSINNRYLVICRYSGTNRIFKVYDIINKTVVTESVLTEAQVGHVNSLAYANGYIYCTTLQENAGVVRLAVNLETLQIAFDSIISPTVYISLCVNNNNVYAWRVDNDKWACYRLTLAFTNAVKLFETDFTNAINYIGMQGCTADDDFLYVSLSGSYIAGTATANELKRFTEYIYVFNKTGDIIKSYNFSRGVYGEIEDIDILTVEQQKYIAVTFNTNDIGVSNTYISPLNTDTEPVNQFMTVDIMDSVYRSYGEDFEVYVSEASGTEFADGTIIKPFKTINAALTFIKRANIPVSLYIRDGNFPVVYLRNIAAPMTIFFDGGTIAGFIIYRVGTLTFDQSSGQPGTTITGQMSVNETIITSRNGPSFSGNNAAFAIALYRSALFGKLANDISGYTNAITGVNSVINTTIGSGVMTVDTTAGVRGWLNNQAVTP